MLCSFCTIFCTICECSGVKEKLELQDEFISAILIFTFTYSWLLYSQTTFIPFSRKPIFHTCVKLYCQRLAPEDNPLPKGPLDFKFASISRQMRRNMRPVSIIQISFDLVLFCCSLHMKSNDIKKKKKNYTCLTESAIYNTYFVGSCRPPFFNNLLSIIEFVQSIAFMACFEGWEDLFSILGSTWHPSKYDSKIICFASRGFVFIEARL